MNWHAALVHSSRKTPYNCILFRTEVVSTIYQPSYRSVQKIYICRITRKYVIPLIHTLYHQTYHQMKTWVIYLCSSMKGRIEFCWKRTEWYELTYKLSLLATKNLGFYELPRLSSLVRRHLHCKPAVAVSSIFWLML